MTDLASLGIQIDARSVKDGVGELDKLTAAGGRAEAATKSLSDEFVTYGGRAKSATAAAADHVAKAQAMAAQLITNAGLLNQVTRATSPLVSSQSALDAAVRRVQSAFIAGTASAGTYAKAQQIAARATQENTAWQQRATNSAGQMRGGMQQLSFQVGDVAQQFALGVSPMRIFAQQSGQVVQAVGLMSNSSRGLMGLIAGPWGAVLTGAVVILGSLWAAHRKAADATDGHTSAAEELTEATNQLHSATVREMQSTQSSIKTDIAKANSLLTRASAARQAAVAELQLAKARLEGARAGAQSGEPGAEGISLVMPMLERDTKRIDEEIRKQQALIDKNNETIRGKRGLQIQQEIAEKYDGVAAAVGKYERAQDSLNGMLRIGIINEKTYRSELDKATGVREKEEKAARDALKHPRAKHPREDHSAERLAERLARDASAINANIAALDSLAGAYLESEESALKAEARVNAAGQAIKKQGDVEKYVAMEMRKLVAQRTVDGAKAVAGLSAQTAAQRQINDAVAAGIIPASQAGQAMQSEAQLRPLIVAHSIAEGQAKEVLATVIARLRGEQAASNAETQRAQVLASTANAKDEIDRLKLEAKLIGETNAVRAVAIAQLAAEQFLRANPGASAADAQAYIDAMKQAAQIGADNTAAQDNYNSSLSYTRDLLAAIGDQANTLGGILSSAFGGFGDSIGGLITTLTDLQTQQQSIADWKRDEIKKAGGDATRLAQIEILAAKGKQTAEMKATAQAISGVKSLFKEKSTAFKVISSVEKAYAAFQAAETIASMVRDATKTASSLANSAVRTTANTAEGGSKIFAELGPWAFPVVAAMVAVLAALGAKGGGGGSSGPSIPTAEDIQDQQGAGSVLGDAKAKSASIANSLEIVASNTNRDLEYSNQMLRALNSIDFGISKLAGTIARQIQVAGSMFDTSKLKLGTSGSGGFLGIGASSTTKTLWDLGLNLDSGSLADIIANGISGETYKIVQKIKKTSGFLGIGGGTSTSYKTKHGEIDPEITAAISDVLASLRDGLISAADVIGLEGAQAILDSFQVNIGKISFKDMTGEEIEETLNAVFSKVGDQMAGALLPSLASLQKVGEGLFETFMRVAREYQVVGIALKSIGMEFGAVGVASIGARDALVQLFGSLDEFVEQTDFFRDNFLSDAEQMAPVISSVRAEMVRLGLAGVTTRDQFKATVLGLDLTTTAGREMYASLLAVAPAFDKVLDYFEKANKVTADALKDTADKFNSFATSLRKYRDTLFASDAAQGNAYATLRAKFIATAALASTGDATALGGLESSGKAFLDSARNNASSLQQYQRDIALVAQGVDKGIFAAESVADYAELQLAALNNSVSILGEIAASTASTAAALGATPGTPVATPAAVANGTAPAPAQAVVITDPDTKAALLSMNGHLFELKQTVKRWDRGDTIAISVDDDAPLNVNLESWG